MRDWIIFFIDTGCDLDLLIDTLTGKPTVLRHPDYPIYDKNEAKETILKMVADGTLSLGSHVGSKDWLVVTEFMPRTAARISRECVFCGHKPAIHKVTTLTPEQQAANQAWSDSFKDGFHTGHCPHLELPSYACQPCYDTHPESHLP